MEINNKKVTMIVRWRDQRREIYININDDINTIEKNIMDTYQLQQRNIFYKYQVQYYHSDYQKFMDLYPRSFDYFQNLLHKLLSSDAPPKSAKEWVLKIIEKASETIRPIMDGIMPDDTYTYQQENDPRESLQDEVSLPAINNTPPVEQSNDNLENTNNNEQEPAGSNVVHSQLICTTDHPCHLGFDDELDIHQRQQYERDMTRHSSSNSTNSGVRLQAYPRSDSATSCTKCYPKIHFNIPADKRGLPWYLHLCIVTEADVNGRHYLHASKGIYDHNEEGQDRFRMIPTGKLYSPYIVQLSEDDIRNGTYIILIKVCNRKNLADLIETRLREYSRLDTLTAYEDQALLSENTTRSLNFLSTKYHLACSLFCDGKREDLCISSLTTAVTSGKPYDNDGSKNGRCGRQKNVRK